jgi:hypothetical protein
MRVIADIPDVLYQQLESFAQREQIPIDGLVAIALSSQLAVWSTRDYLAEKSRRVSWDEFEKVLAKVPNGEPDECDRL